MIRMSKKVRLTVISIAAWTIVQTIFHAFWVVYCYLLTICKIKPTYYDVVLVYLTYFYRESCGDIDLKNEAFFLNSTSSELDFDNETVSDTLYDFLKATLTLGKLPVISNAASRTDIYMFLFLYTDVMWIVSSIFLFVGAFYERKKKVLSILFYGPWMIICTFATVLDVVASVHFGLDMIYTHSYTAWLQFIGISNYKDFEAFNDYASSRFMLAMPSTIIVCLLSRVFFVWLINIFCFFIILFIAIPDTSFTNIVRPMPSKSRKSRESKLKFDNGGELDLNSSEARIRNWQQFYGAIEANSTLASSSSNSSGTSNSTDHNYNSRSNDRDNKVAKKQLEAYYKIDNLDPDLHNKHSDEAHGNPVLPIIDTTNVKMQVLRGQLPWSYINPEGQYFGKNHAYTNKPIQNRIHITSKERDDTAKSSPTSHTVAML